MVSELIKKCRSFRRFDEKRRISEDELRSYVESARYTPSAANLQRLRFALFTDKASCDAIFGGLRFAAYLKDWQGPAPGERPAAYVVITSDKELDVNLAIDLGIVSEAILLTASEAGVGGCIFRSYSSETVLPLISTEGQVICEVIALGYPAEEVVISDLKDGDIKYYRDAEDRHVVPKRSLDELIIK